MSPTDENSKVIGPKGYSHIYAALEILKFVIDNNPIINPEIYSPWKCQVYSFGILMLQLIGFFSNQMDSKCLDQLKLSDKEFNKLVNILEKYTKKLTYPLMSNIVLALKIFLSYKSDERLSGNELIEIRAELDSKNEDTLFNQYKLNLNRQISTDQKLTSSFESSSSLISQRINEDKDKIILLQ